MNSRTNCLERAGHILIFCIWIEKRLVDLIVLKDRPVLIKRVNKSSLTVNLPYTFVKERTRLWEKDFAVIKNKFIELYKPNESWKDNLEGIYDWRNIIGHSHVSLHRDYILYRPSGKRRKKNRLIKNHITERRENQAKPLQMTIRFSDDEKYNRMVKVITEFEGVYLKSIADNMGLDYEKIR